MPFTLINEANFFVVFIALILVFFLLGLLIGNRIDRPKKSEKNKKKEPSETDNQISEQTDTLGQDNPDNMDDQGFGQNQKPRDYKTRYHNNYW